MSYPPLYPPPYLPPLPIPPPRCRFIGDPCYGVILDFQLNILSMTIRDYVQTKCYITNACIMQIICNFLTINN